MPFKSDKQRAYLEKNKPDVAKKFEEDSDGGKSARIKRIVDHISKPKGSNQVTGQLLTDSVSADDMEDAANDGEDFNEPEAEMKGEATMDDLEDIANDPADEDRPGKLFKGKDIHIIIKHGK